MPNSTKIAKVDDLAQKISAAKSVALLQYQGLKALDISALRRQVKATGGVIEVTKNSLISRALAKIGLRLPVPLAGPTALALSHQDEIAPLKEIEKINQAKNLTEFKYGIYDHRLLSLEEPKRFLSLPSKTTLISQFIGGLYNPLQRLIYALRFNQTQLVLTLKAISEKK